MSPTEGDDLSHFSTGSNLRNDWSADAIRSQVDALGFLRDTVTNDLQLLTREGSVRNCSMDKPSLSSIGWCGVSAQTLSYA